MKKYGLERIAIDSPITLTEPITPTPTYVPPGMLKIYARDDGSGNFVLCIIDEDLNEFCTDAGFGFGVGDHGALTGLSDDDHTIYALLAGRSGGQVLKGGTLAADDLTLQSTSGNGSGDQIIFKTGNNGSLTPLVINSSLTGDLVLIGSATGQRSSLAVCRDHVTSSPNANGLIVFDSFSGSGDTPAGAQVFPTFHPTAGLTTAIAVHMSSYYNLDNDVTIADLIGLQAQISGEGDTGDITRAAAILVAAPAVSGTTKPTTIYGIDVRDQGLAGITNAVALKLALPTNADNNYYLEVDDVSDTTAGDSTYFARLPVKTTSGTKYLHLFDDGGGSGGGGSAWDVLTNGDEDWPELIFAGGDVIMTET